MNNNEDLNTNIRLENSSKVAVIDKEDLEFVTQFKWYLGCGGYAVTFINSKPFFMHNMIMRVERGIDHIDRDKLNNTKRNLRVVSRSHNRQNSLDKRNKSKFKGVYFSPRLCKWIAKIKKDGVAKHLGCFMTPEEAARAYDKHALEWYGPDALTNEKLR